MHGGEHDLAGREEERDLAVEVEDQAPEEEGDHHGRRDGDDDGEARASAAPGAELVCHSHPAVSGESLPVSVLISEEENEWNLV